MFGPAGYEVVHQLSEEVRVTGATQSFLQQADGPRRVLRVYRL